MWIETSRWFGTQWTLTSGRDTLGWVKPTRGRWYFYTLGFNSWPKTYLSPETAKRALEEHLRAE